VTACIGEPISWPALERVALGAVEPAIASHLAACPACQHCLDQIRSDQVALRPLERAAASPVAARRSTRRRRWLAPVVAVAAAAAVAVIVLRPPGAEPGAASGIVGVKGIGEVALSLVRERGGAISYAASHYAPGDRWKLVVSCPPGAAGSALWLELSVADGISVDHPLPAAQLACGNRVVVPGAFAITGQRANQVCARIAAAPGSGPGDAGTACVTLHPEPR
jgi:hypothetical protein